ncbi:alanine--tRNA ligase [Candidatus Bandiella numerosa]|uniref:alanine--tRNA ligase n=1 Tax=Candidatus Bandiella numerosa TaxID=2570586 RepID=UPI00249EECB8|nr:alanine--tRNA ligase [Candidatus Bandiella numerosa]WHA04817.1 alanine--tRNA ligase [Candidatus Bandiella numerosa]
MLLNDIRESFLNYFQKNNHKILASSTLIPHNDPTLLFTNSGMVQFKNQFTGKEKIEYPRVATSQKCIRAGGKHNDLENVGFTARHHTFFEMLGNFSFGDYFKEKAIFYAWEYLTKELQIDKKKLYITVYHEDIEALNLWKKISNFSDDKIIKIKTNDNFWSMGDVGPCGPCSEIFYDHGEKYFGGLPGTKDENGDRYVEIWNLVFMQYEKLKSGDQINLPKPSIDTGMGLERISAVMQGVNDNYDTDLFKKLINAIIELTGNNQKIVSNKVIADHIRSSCFLIADGVLPSNEGRGYVLRRIMRRAMRHVHNIEYDNNLLSKIAPIFISEMKSSYPELLEARDLIISTLNMEEERFKNTLKNGLKYLNEEIDYLPKDGILSGIKAFKLYDTYGFPLDLTVDILKERNLQLDHQGFETAMQEQKIRAKANWSGSGEIGISPIWYDIYDKFGSTEFIRKENANFVGKIQAIIVNDKSVGFANDGEKAVIITDQTPFYAECGGQIGDKGLINNSKIYDTKLFVGKIHGHFVHLSEKLNVGDEVKLLVNYELRNKIKANHSATHLLHFALRNNLGKHVVQKGSLVNDEKLRFDFTHNKGLTKAELIEVEKLVNTMIIANKRISTNLMNIDNAKKCGAMALFGEKYDDEVRVISMGDSIELCGGTHANYTGEIGLFAISSEESIAAGVRRIEALTGIKALDYFRNKADKTEEIVQLLRCKEENIVNDVSNLQNQIKSLTKINEQCKNELLLLRLEEISVNDNKILLLKLNEQKVDLKSIYDSLKNNAKSVIVLINTDKSNNKTSLLIGVSKDILPQYNAKELLQKCFDIIDGNGGGNSDFAQASGKNINVEEKILNIVKNSL